MSFRKLRGVHLPEEKQGYIRYACLTAGEQPKYLRDKIERLCQQCGGAYADALRDVMCSHKSIVAISLQHAVAESTLYRLRKLFYESW